MHVNISVPQGSNSWRSVASHACRLTLCLYKYVGLLIECEAKASPLLIGLLDLRLEEGHCSLGSCHAELFASQGTVSIFIRGSRNQFVPCLGSRCVPLRLMWCKPVCLVCPSPAVSSVLNWSSWLIAAGVRKLWLSPLLQKCSLLLSCC
jgi:hypothetical protein